VIFKYTRLDSAFERPYVEITVGHEGSEEAYLTLVDSGADINVFSASLANDLGIDMEKGSPLTVRGATGEAETFYMHPVTITVGGVTFETEAAFADIPHLELAGLAGQRGFFDQFKVTFNFREGEIDLTEPRSDAAA
jgi:hypothetical protein